MVTATMLVQPSLFAAARTFIPDATFTGSSLSTLHPLGDADWKANDGEIVGDPKSASGGWLILDKSYQDVALYTNFTCSNGCKTGILLRAEKTADGGMKGILISLSDGDLHPYRITLDSQGKELTREQLGSASNHRGDPAVHMYPPPPQDRFTPELASSTFALPPDIPATRPDGTLHKDGWNELEIIVDATQTKVLLNEGPIAALSGAAVPDAGNYGPIALYVGGSGEVQYKDISFKDLNINIIPKEYVSPNYHMQRLSDLYYSWSAAVGDINGDGIPDVATGALYYLGPDYTTTHEIFIPESYDPSSEYPRSCMVNFLYDFTGDGYPDQWCATGNNGNGPGVLYVNPGKDQNRRWDRYVVTPDVYIEETVLGDVYGDGKKEIVMGIPGGTIVVAAPDPSAPTKSWKLTPISEPGPWATNNPHGLGVGDINGDGRPDVVTAYGWFEQPPKGTKQLWKFHPYAFGRWGVTQGHAGGAEMGIYDVNGDGLPDVVTSLEAHGWGLAWFEQKRSASGDISWVRHIIMDNFQTKNAGDVTFTEPHGATFADVDGDGIKDFIVGKRFMSHFGYNDPDPYGASVLYVYHVVRDPKAPGGARFVPELIHNRSGVGSHIVAADLKNDGTIDIITSAAHGAFIFWGTKPSNKTSSASGQ
jgi:hypothetical protein